nr:immunoglobulin light chain junction region [Macaca mulatta]
DYYCQSNDSSLSVFF